MIFNNVVMSSIISSFRVSLSHSLSSSSKMKTEGLSQGARLRSVSVTCDNAAESLQANQSTDHRMCELIY